MEDQEHQCPILILDHTIQVEEWNKQPFWEGDRDRDRGSPGNCANKITWELIFIYEKANFSKKQIKHLQVVGDYVGQFKALFIAQAIHV